MAKIWGISEGAYSDYGVLAIFSTEEKARAYLDEYNKIRHNDARLEEFDLDPEPPQSVTVVRVNIRKNGDVIMVSDPCREAIENVGFRQYGGYYRDLGLFLWWYVQTDDQERAVKVANEKRAMLIAAGVWGDYAATHALLDTDCANDPE
jgi:hypothetical protein